MPSELKQACKTYFSESSSGLIEFDSNWQRIFVTTLIYRLDQAMFFFCISDPKTSNIMDMCDTSNMSFIETLHLMYKHSAKISATKCECHIHGNFSVALNDVRLGVNQLNTCSSARLQINNNLFKCEENVVNFGALFQTMSEFNSPFAYILMTLDSTSSLTTAWLKIEPTGNLFELFSLNLHILPNLLFTFWRKV